MGAKTESRVVIVGGVVVLSLVFMIVMTLILLSNISNNVKKNRESTPMVMPTATSEQSVYFGLPETFPKDMPLPPRSRVTAVQESKDDQSAVFLTAVTIEAVEEFYNNQLSEKGWEITNQSQGGGITIFYVTKDGKEAIVAVGKGEAGVTVSITILKS